MKILVTGGAGFIGSHIVDALIKRGDDVIVIDNLSSGNLKNLPLFVKFYNVDIKDYEKLKEIFEKEKPEFIFHLAANIDLRKSVAEPIMDAQANIIGSLNLLELCREFSVKKIIFSSSGAVYGDTALPYKEEQIPLPKSPYAISKFAVEKYLDFYKETYGLDWAALRYANVYGPRQNPKGEAGVIGIFLSKMFAGEQPVIFGSGLKTRDYVYVEDVVKANLLALNSGHGIYNVGTAKETNVIEIFNLINKLFDNKFEEKHAEEKKGEIERACLSYEKIKQELGWEPTTDLKDGVEKVYSWLITLSNNPSKQTN